MTSLSSSPVRFTVAFRVDASSAMGSGHLSRCLTLADALWAAGAKIGFITRAPADHTRKWLSSKGYSILPLAPPTRAPAPITEEYSRWLGVTREEDAADTVSALDAFKADLLIVDHYGLDADWERQTQGKVSKVMAIDDIANRPHACDFLLDQNLHPNHDSRYRNLVPEHCRNFFGPGFALLRPDFASARSSMPQRTGALGRILVCFGGADPTNETGKALEGIFLGCYGNLQVTVVAGAFNPNYEDIRRVWSGRPGIVIHAHTEHMARLMAENDLAIGAGGTTTWERCCLGLPSLTATLAENQAGTTLAVAAHGAQVALGKAEELDSGDYAEAIARLESADLLRMSRSGMDLVDGMGCSRVAAGIMEAMEIGGVS